MPGQLGPTMRDLFCDLSMSVMRTMSSRVSRRVCQGSGRSSVPCCGMPSVILAVVSFWYAPSSHAHLRHNQRYLCSDGFLNTLGGNWRAACKSVCVGRGGALFGGAYGTKMAEAVAPVSLIASATLAKTGLPRCSEPAFLGFVPPTTFVPVSDTSMPRPHHLIRRWSGRIPYSIACCAWKLSLLSRPFFCEASACPLTCPAFQ
jgi:hypothetical protein